MSDDLVAHYRKLYEQHGASAEAVQWADRDSQEARFAVLTGVADPLTSVLDVGCGLGDLCVYLRQRGFAGRYHGVDIVPEFVDHANATFQDDPNAMASVSEPRDDLPSGCDYAILSGVFNNAMDDNQGFMEATLRAMWTAAEKGIAFNAMSTWVDYKDDGLWYVDPAQVFAFCKRELGGHVTLRHDYALRPGGFPFEFAMYVLKDPVFPEGPRP